MKAEYIFEKIKVKMQLMGYSFNRLCTEAELAHSYFSVWKKNITKIPTLDSLNKICDALKMDLTSLLFSDETFDNVSLEAKELIKKFELLSKIEKNAVMTVINSYLDVGDKKHAKT